MIISEKFIANKKAVALGLLLPPLLIYFKSLFYDFTTLDEQWMIVNNARFLESGRGLTTAFTSLLADVYYRPLLLLSIVLDHKIGGLSPFIYHFTNLALHLACVLLFFRLLVLFNIDRTKAFLLSLIFSVAPIHLHAVAWVPGRNDTLLCACVLSSLIFLKLFLDRKENKFLVLHFLFFALSLITKESSVVLPLLYIFCWWLHEKKLDKKLTAPIFVWSTLIVAFLLARRQLMTGDVSTTIDIALNLKHTVVAMIVYLGKMVLPVQLSVFPTLRNATLWPGLVSILLICLLIRVRHFKDNRLAILGALTFFVTLFIPVWFSAASSGREHYEHRAYLSMVGLLIFFSQYNIKFDLKRTQVVFLIIAAVFGVRTFLRMDAYKDKETFLSYAVKECPDHYLFHMQMGEMYFANQDGEKAISSFNKAIELRDNKYEIYSNRGTAYFKMRMFPEAIKDLTKSIELSEGKDAMAYVNRCCAYSASGDVDNAIKDLILLKNCCAAMIPPFLEKEISEKWATQELRKVNESIATEPNNAVLYLKRAGIYRNVGDREMAIKDLKKAMELDPKNKEYQKLYEKFSSMK